MCGILPTSVYSPNIPHQPCTQGQSQAGFGVYAGPGEELPDV